MASEEHKQFANIIKDVHDSLRKRSKIIGADEAWKEHLMDKERLSQYANAMAALASIWEANSSRVDDDSVTQKVYARSRVKWTIEYVNSYFFTECIYLEKRLREDRLLDSWADCDKSECAYLDELPTVIRVLDVGSCSNMFQHVPYFDVTALDLCPANDDVFRGDFLKIKVVAPSDYLKNEKQHNVEILNLPSAYFECIIFSLLLEYIPSSEQRLKCCRKAYELLRSEGILIIITPDSQHVGKNAALMKTWRYALSTLGFVRIRFEKLPHITCMVFRKAINPRLGCRWAETHRESYMNVAIEIPQDTKYEVLK